MDHIVRCMLDVDTNDYGDDLQHASYIDTDDYPDHHHQQLQQQQQQQQQQQKQAKPKSKPEKPAEEKPYVWRMHSQSERKYQLFPKDKQQPAPLTMATSNSSSSSASSTTASSTTAAAGDKQSEKSDKADKEKSGGLRLRMKEHSLVRRRKISVPDLGPMTTVQEVAMDSPTIPGRPPLHERSISAPGNSWKKHHLVDCMIQPAYDDIPETSVYMSFDDLVSSPIEEVPRCSSAQAVLSPTVSAAMASSSLSTTMTMSHSPSLEADSPKITVRQPLSPKVLAPLVIPPLHSHSQSSQPSHVHNFQNRYHHQTSTSLSSNLLRPSASNTSLSGQAASQSAGLTSAPHTLNNRYRSSTTPVENTLRSARSDESPRTRTPFTPYTPMSAVSTTSTLPTPISATTSATLTDNKYNYVMSASKDKENEPAEAPRSATPSIVKISTMPTTATLLGHRRGQSDTGSIMERGRPRKRSASREGSTSAAISAMVSATGHKASESSPAPALSTSAPTSATANAATAAAAAAAAISTAMAASASASTAEVAAAAAPTAASNTPTPGLKRSASKSGMKNAAERRAFEMLPRGWKASDAPNYLDSSDVAALATQALQQAARFEVLRKEDVDSLSRELRSLDERCEYLRRTYTSLRAGRRNLHGRICQYLRSPRVAKFSHDSMLKQEEALADLDTSIDDWVTKLEHADNRRTRVRQKLLEHVAAAATLPLTSSLAAVAVAAAGIVPAAAVTSALALNSPLANAAQATSPLSNAGLAGVSESLQLAMGIKPVAPTPFPDSTTTTTVKQTISTPPRSPTKAAPTPAAYSIISPVASSSPQRPIVAQVPSTILEQPLVEEAMATIAKSEAAAAAAAAAAALAAKSETKPAAIAVAATIPDASNAVTVPDTPLSPASTLNGIGGRRVDVESIRIYAGDDVYALLADVESQITQMGGTPAAVPTSGTASAAVSAAVAAAAPATAPVVGNAYDYFSIPQHTRLTQQERRELHRAHSQELLNGGSHPSSKRSTPTPPASPGLSGSSGSGSSTSNSSNSSDAGVSKTAVPTAATSSSSSRTPSPTDDEPQIFLTNAVFRPDRSMLVM